MSPDQAAWKKDRIGNYVARFKNLNGSGSRVPLSVTKDQGIVLQSEKFKKRIAIAESSKYLIVRRGEFAFDPMSLYYGAIGKLESIDEGIVSPAYITFSLKDGLDSAYFSYFCKTREFISVVNSVTVGGNIDGKRKKTDWDAFCSLPILVPPLGEQRRIAEILSSVDDAIQATQAVIEQTRKVKQGVLKRLLTMGIGHTRFKQTEIGEIPEGWDVVPISAVSLRTTYGFTNPMPTTESGPWMITAANVRDGKIDYSTARKTDQTAYRTLLSEKSRPEKGVVLITKDGTLGRVAIVDRQNICINQSVASLTPDENKISSEFLVFTLQAPQMQERILSESGGTSVKHIYITKLADTLLPLPPIPEQARIVERLQAVEVQLGHQVEHLTQLQITKSALMSDLLTGRKRVSDGLLMAAE